MRLGGGEEYGTDGVLCTFEELGLLLGRRVPNPRVFFLLLRRVGNRTEAALDRDRDGSWLRWLMNGDVGRNAGMLLLQGLQLRYRDAMREGVGREGFDVITDFCDLDANGDEWGHVGGGVNPS